MGRSLVYGTMAAVGMLAGTTTLAEAGDPHCDHHHGHGHGYYGYRGRGGYGVGFGVGYAPRPVYAPPPAYYYGAPVYPQPVYVAPPPYPYGYAPYPASGLGISTKNFGLWLGN